MMQRNSYHKAVYAAVLASLTLTNLACFDGMEQAAMSDESSQPLSAKKSQSWVPPGLDGQGKGVGPREEAEPMASANMEYVWDGLDLESDSIYTAPPGDPLSPDVDFHLAYNADTEVHLRVFQHYPASIAMLDGVAVADVGCGHLEGLTTTEDLIDEPLHADDTMIIVTADGNTYKVGNAVEHEDMTVSLNYQQMDCGS